MAPQNRQQQLRLPKLLICCAFFVFSLSLGQTSSAEIDKIDNNQKVNLPVLTPPAAPVVLATDAETSSISSSIYSNIKNSAIYAIRADVRLIQKGAQKWFAPLLSERVEMLDLESTQSDFRSSTDEQRISEAPPAVNASQTPAAPALKMFSTPFATFWSSVASSFTLTLVTEFGDRTFFIAALLATKHPRLPVFIGTCLALIIQTVFSTLVGQLLHRIPSISSSFMSFPFDDYAAALLLFVFGIVHLRAAWNPNVEDEAAADSMSLCYGVRANNEHNSAVTSTATSVEDVYTKCPDGDEVVIADLPPSVYYYSPPSVVAESSSSRSAGLAKSDLLLPKSGEATSSAGVKSEKTHVSTNGDNCSTVWDSPLSRPEDMTVLQLAGGQASQRLVSDGSNPSRPRQWREHKEAEEAARKLELRQNSEHPSTRFEVFTEVFWVIFVAELGDKSMFSTVALAAAQNSFGVFVGASGAHCLVTLVAIIAGALLHGVISERIANMIGAVLFLVFGSMALLEGLARQGIPLWWFLGEKSSALFIAYFITVKNVSFFNPSAGAATAPSFFDGIFPTRYN